MKYEHVIWDWNGTLFNDAGLCCDIMNVTLRDLGYPEVSFDFYQQNLKHPMIDFFRMIVPDTTDEQWSEFSRHFHERYAERRLECYLHDHSEKVLNIFKGRGSTQSILSAHPQDYLDFIVNHFNLRGFFSRIYGAKNNLAASKVSRGIELIRESDHSPKTTVVIGDTDHDAEVAKEIGAECILIANGFQHRSVLERCNVPVYRSLSDLVESLSV